MPEIEGTSYTGEVIELDDGMTVDGRGAFLCNNDNLLIGFFK